MRGGIDEKTRKSFKTSAFEMEVGILKGADQKRKTYDEADGCLCVAIHVGRHRVQLALAK